MIAYGVNDRGFVGRLRGSVLYTMGGGYGVSHGVVGYMTGGLMG